MKNYIQPLFWLWLLFKKPQTPPTALVIATTTSRYEQELIQCSTDINAIIRDYKKKATLLANQGLEDGTRNIPAFDSATLCPSEEMFSQSATTEKKRIADRIAQADGWFTNEQQRLAEEAKEIETEGIERFIRIGNEARQSELDGAKWITNKVSLLGAKVFFDEELASDRQTYLKDKARQIGNQINGLSIPFAKLATDSYPNGIPEARPFIDDVKFWWVIGVVFGIEVLISFQGIQFLGAAGNAPAFFLAAILAGIAAKSVHMLGGYLYNNMTYGTERGKLYITSALTLVICALLSGIRMNMSSANIVLLILNLFLTAFAIFLSYLRAEHAPIFSMQNTLAWMNEAKNNCKNEHKRIDADQKEKAERINAKHDEKAEIEMKEAMKKLRQELKDCRRIQEELNATMPSKSNHIDEIQHHNYELYKKYNSKSREGIHPPVLRWTGKE